MKQTLQQVAEEYKIPYEETRQLYIYESNKLLERDWPKKGSFIHVPQTTYDIIERYYRAQQNAPITIETIQPYKNAINNAIQDHKILEYIKELSNNKKHFFQLTNRHSKLRTYHENLLENISDDCDDEFNPIYESLLGITYQILLEKKSEKNLNNK